MPNPSSISRRIHSCITYINNCNYESALVHYFPALDKTAKRRRPKAGVGERIRQFISDQEAIVTAVATGNIIKNININGISFPDAIYKFGRTAIAHEGELDPRLQFNDTGELQIGNIWNLPSSYIIGLCVGVIVAPENAEEFIAAPLSLMILGHNFQINELWGAESRVKEVIAEAFRNPALFR